MSEPVDVAERKELCRLFLELGPDAPTLCEGWTTSDLAAHLVLREHFRRWPDARIAAEKEKGFAPLVERLQKGAPAVPWRIPGLRGLLNGGEYFIHHEDVRRANGLGPRAADPDRERQSWKMLGFLGRRTAKKLKPAALRLVADDGRERSFGQGEAAATLTGPPSEMVLYLSGRTGAAVVGLDGPPDALEALKGAARGF